MRRRYIPLAALCAATAACSTTPTVTKQKAHMTPREMREAGLVCRDTPVAGSHLPRTICASPESWASYDKRARLGSEELMAEGRKLSNVGRFNRD
jgi:hypothetical protein